MPSSHQLLTARQEHEQLPNGQSKGKQRGDDAHMGAEAVTSGPERGAGFPDATQLISHPSLRALAPPGNHLIMEPPQKEEAMLRVCNHARSMSGRTEVRHCEPLPGQRDTQPEGAAVGEVPTVTACFATPLCPGLAPRMQRSQTIYIRLCGDSWWESDLLEVRK